MTSPHMPLTSQAFAACSDDPRAREWYALFVDAHDSLARVAAQLRRMGHELAAGTVEWLAKQLDGVGAFVIGGTGA